MTDKTFGQVADVYKERTLVGKLTRTDKGAVFEYDKNYLELAGAKEGIAYNLPASQVRYETFGVNLNTFFAGLLPEGLRLEALTKGIKTSKDDLFSLLIAAGTDCIGDISVVPEHEELSDLSPDVDLKHIDDVSFEELFRKSISYSDTKSKIIKEITLPGIQNKISAGLISFPVRAAAKDRAFILKLNPPDKPMLVQNEYFFLKLARELKLRSANAEIVMDREGKSGLLVGRFDRIFMPSEKYPRKVHQEDACQFLDRYPADKYTQINCRMIAEGIERFCTAPILEIAKFIKLVAFSYIIGNGDLHAKNVSIFTSPITGRTELTPAYDLLSTLPYGDDRLALKFEGRDDNLKRKDIINFGERYGVRRIATESMLNELCEGVLKRISDVGEVGFIVKIERHLVLMMKKRCRDLME